jgi:hypothetical protein
MPAENFSRLFEYVPGDTIFTSQKHRLPFSINEKNLEHLFVIKIHCQMIGARVAELGIQTVNLHTKVGTFKCL